MDRQKYYQRRKIESTYLVQQELESLRKELHIAVLEKEDIEEKFEIFQVRGIQFLVDQKCFFKETALIKVYENFYDLYHFSQTAVAKPFKHHLYLNFIKFKFLC